jgi:hypothetical protein
MAAPHQPPSHHPPPEIPPPDGPVPDLPPPDRPVQEVPVVDVRTLQHPYEFSRLLLALSSTVIVFGAIVLWIFLVLPELAVPYLAPVVVLLLLVALAIWLLVLVHRARLLGSAVLVTPATLPRLAEVVEQVRTSLDYRRRVDVYVTEKAPSPVTTWNYLGTRIILLEGGLIADLQEDATRPQLVFLLGSEFGRLKARHRRFTLVVAWLEGQENLRLLHLFLAPYFRATTYSGDQIGAACADDVTAGAAMMNRLLVGKDLSPSLAVSGVLDQAARVRSRWLPRVAQLAMDRPHLTNRYLNLLAFAEQRFPAAAQEYFDSVEPSTRERLLHVIEDSPHRRKPAGSRRTVPAVIAAVVTMIALVLAGVAGVQARRLLLTLGEEDVAVEPEDTGTPEDPTTPEESPEPAPATAAEVLLGHLPKSFVGRCQEVSEQDPAQARGLIVELSCSPNTGDPEQMYFLQYESVHAAEEVYSYLTGGTTLPEGTCLSTDPGRGDVVQGAVTTGRYGCYQTDAGDNVYVWTDLEQGIMGVAADSAMTFFQLRWWQTLDAQLT